METNVLEIFQFNFLALAKRIKLNIYDRALHTTELISNFKFKQLYGLTPYQTAVTWNMIQQKLQVCNRFKKKHLLWTLMFLWVYPT